MLLAALIALLLLLGAGLWLALQSQAQVQRTADVSVVDVARAMRLLRTIDPRRQGGEGLRQVNLSQRETELLLDQVSQRTVPAATRITLQPLRLRLQASVGLKGVLAGHWLNIDATLRQTTELPDIDQLRIGDLPVPGWAAEWALPWLLAQQIGADELRLAREVVQGLAFDADKLSVRYVWHAGTAGRLLGTLVPRADQDRLRTYVERLAALKLRSVAGGRIPLVQLMTPVFELAQQRTAAGGDAAQENRSAILALAFAPYPRQLVAVVPAARQWRLPPRWRITLQGRDDFPLHFMISAALAVEGGGPLADAIGVFKEVLDAGDGSGFSFNDVAADRTGSRFGQLALRAPQRVQQVLAQGITDAELMPDVSDLPEFLRAAEFNSRYGGIDAPAYRQQLADIDRRIRALSLYQ